MGVKCPSAPRIYLIIILCVGLKDMAERRLFSVGQGQGQDREKESGESFAAGFASLGEATDDRWE